MSALYRIISSGRMIQKHEWGMVLSFEFDQVIFYLGNSSQNILLLLLQLAETLTHEFI